ncbi:hypothetical protein ACFE04_015664 [Oxalis oulophora]
MLWKNTNLKQTLVTLLDRYCKSLTNLKQIHALVITSGLSQEDDSLLLPSKLTNNNIDYSYKVLLQLTNPTPFNWHTVVMAYSKTKNPNKAISVFVKMLSLGVSPDYLIYPFVLKASASCLNIKHGVMLHCHILRTGYESDRFIANSLIHIYASCSDIRSARQVFDILPMKNLVSWNSMLDGYAKCGDMNMARQVFDSMLERDVVTWSSLIDGYVKSGGYGEAMGVFRKMRKVGPKANEVTMVSVLCACAHLGALDQGRAMHNYMIDNELPLTLVLRTSLIDMYAKCGAINDALTMFRGVLKEKTDVLIWNAIIGGLATHGLVRESLDLFMEMQVVGIVPDEITYLCLLSACAHGGLVKEAWDFFNRLRKPKHEHYACMVDVLARAGQVTKAYQFVCEMPMAPNASVLGALLSGCMNHGKLDLAEIVGRKLIDLEPDHDGRYVGLSNVYAIEKRWEDARSTREAMEKRGVKKSPGFSVVEMSGAVHRFIAHDKSHSNSEQIYMMLKFLVSQMKLDFDDEFVFYS